MQGGQMTKGDLGEILEEAHLFISAELPAQKRSDHKRGYNMQLNWSCTCTEPLLQ